MITVQFMTPWNVRTPPLQTNATTRNLRRVLALAR